MAVTLRLCSAVRMVAGTMMEFLVLVPYLDHTEQPLEPTGHLWTFRLSARSLDEALAQAEVQVTDSAWMRRHFFEETEGDQLSEATRALFTIGKVDVVEVDSPLAIGPFLKVERIEA